MKEKNANRLSTVQCHIEIKFTQANRIQTSLLACIEEARQLLEQPSSDAKVAS